MGEVTARRSRLVILVLGLCGTVVSLMQTLVVPLLPDFPALLGTTPDNASWLVTVTLLVSAVVTPIISRLADMVGKRLMMLVSLGVLVAGSVLGALSDSLTGVLVARALQGFAPAVIPIGISIMRDELPPERLGSGVALMSATLGIGGAVGLPLAGVIYEAMDWHALFWVSAAMGGVMAVAVRALVPESQVRSRGRFDLPGAVVLSGILTTLLLAISKGGQWGWTSEATLGCFLAAAVLTAVWVPMELRTGQPLVDLRTSARRPVLLTNVASLLAGFVMFANLLATTQQLQLPVAGGSGFGLSVTEAGLGMLPGGVLMVLLAGTSARITRRYGARATLALGMLAMGAGYVVRVFGYHAVWQVVLGAAVISVGTAVAFAAMPVLIMRSVPITETAAANGLNTLVRAIGTSTASAVMVAVLTATTVSVGGVEVPSVLAFQEVFWLAAFAAVVAAGLAMLLPGRTSADEGDAVRDETALKHADSAEFVVRGRVLQPAGAPLKQAVVSVLRPDGTPVDWSRADNDGHWSLALPEPGDYLVVAGADGWAPKSQIVGFGRPDADGAATGIITLEARLRACGTVSDGGTSVAGALVVLTSTSGEAAGSATTGDDGAWSMRLPPSGRYVVTVVTPAGDTVAVEHVVTAALRRVDLDLADHART